MWTQIKIEKLFCAGYTVADEDWKKLSGGYVVADRSDIFFIIYRARLRCSIAEKTGKMVSV